MGWWRRIRVCRNGPSQGDIAFMDVVSHGQFGVISMNTSLSLATSQSLHAQNSVCLLVVSQAWSFAESRGQFLVVAS
jgi:hypothetical protein